MVDRTFVIPWVIRRQKTFKTNSELNKEANSIWKRKLPEPKSI